MTAMEKIGAMTKLGQYRGTAERKIAESTKTLTVISTIVRSVCLFDIFDH